MARWIVDASNVMGTRPDGWWRDRPSALNRLLDEITRWHLEVGEPVTMVLDGHPTPTGPRPGTWAGVEVRYADRSGRDAADDAIVDLLTARAERLDDVVVATSDRALAARVLDRGARVEGAGRFRQRLADIEPRRRDRAVLGVAADRRCP